MGLTAHQSGTKMQKNIQKNKTKGVAFQTMAMFAKFHNNLGSFQDMFYRTWFIFLIVGFVLPFLCAYADFEVLFGIYYDSSQSYWTASIKAGLEAAMIQLGILIAGGIALKILINWKFNNWSWTLQFFLFAALSVICIIRTFDLSYQTYYSSKANSYENKQLMDDKHMNNINAKEAQRDTTITQLNTEQNNKLETINSQYIAMLDTKTKKWMDKKTDKEAKYRQGRITKDRYTSKINEYNGYINEVKVTQLGIKNARTDSLTKVYDALLLEAKSRYNKELDNIRSTNKAEADELGSSIEDNATATQGRNIGLNAISLLLQLGGLLYVRGVNNEIGENDDEEENKEDETPKTPKNSSSNNRETRVNNTASIPTQTSDIDTVYNAQNNKKTTEQKQATTNPNSLYHSNKQDKQVQTTTQKQVPDTTNASAVLSTNKQFVAKNGITVYWQDGMFCVKHLVERGSNKGGETYLGLPQVNSRLVTYRNRVRDYSKQGKMEYAVTNQEMLDYWTIRYEAIQEACN